MAAVNLTQKEFKEALVGERPILVEFWAPWCVYCRRISPVVEKVAEQYADTLTVGLVNIDDEPGLAAEEQIEVIPTLVLYQNGQALGSIVAPESKATVDRFIQEAQAR